MCDGSSGSLWKRSRTRPNGQGDSTVRVPTQVCVAADIDLGADGATVQSSYQVAPTTRTSLLTSVCITCV